NFEAGRLRQWGRLADRPAAVEQIPSQARQSHQEYEHQPGIAPREAVALLPAVGINRARDGNQNGDEGSGAEVSLIDRNTILRFGQLMKPVNEGQRDRRRNGKASDDRDRPRRLDAHARVERDAPAAREMTRGVEPMQIILKLVPRRLADGMT